MWYSLSFGLQKFCSQCSRRDDCNMGQPNARAFGLPFFFNGMNIPIAICVALGKIFFLSTFTSDFMMREPSSPGIIDDPDARY